tara:strand:+ start:140 stop:535 length:396 start_codon:yes stop_codon:yes gene_type:complete
MKNLPKEKIQAMESTLEKMKDFDTVLSDMTKSLEGKYNRAEAKVMDKKFNEYVHKNQLKEVVADMDKYVKQSAFDSLTMDMIQMNTKIDGLVFKAYLDDQIGQVKAYIDSHMDTVVTGKRLENEMKVISEA